MSILRIAICDSDTAYANKLKRMLSVYFTKKQYTFEIDLFPRGREFMALEYNMLRYHLVIIEVDLQDMNGMDIAWRLYRLSDEPVIFFISESDKYMIDGYKVRAVRYVLKSYEDFDIWLEGGLDAACKRIKVRPHIYTMSFMEGRKTISSEDIVYIESNLHRLKFHVQEEEIKIYNIYETLNNMAEFITGDFVRVHQSYLVNLKYVSELDGNDMKLMGDIKVPIARTRIKEVKNKLAAYREKQINNLCPGDEN